MTIEHAQVKHRTSTTAEYRQVYIDSANFIDENVGDGRNPTLHSFAKSSSRSIRSVRRALAFFDMRWRDMVSNARFWQATLMMVDGLDDERIAAKLGYTNVHTFRIAFERVCGVDTHEYREMRANG